MVSFVCDDPLVESAGIWRLKFVGLSVLILLLEFVRSEHREMT